MIRIRLFGGLSVARDDQRLPAPSATQPRRLAILATIAQSGERGVSRDRLVELFWPDGSEEVARRGLTQALYALRTGLDDEQLLLGVQELRLNRDVATCDVLEYADAIDGGELERAARLYSGPFLDGFRVPGLADFDRRIEEQRAELARRHETLLERLAVNATKRGETDQAVDWWRQRASMDPFSGRIAEAYMRARAAAGDRIGAIRHARVHEQLVAQEFGTEAAASVTALAEQLRAELETPGPPPAAPATIAETPRASSEPLPVPVMPVPMPLPVPEARPAESPTMHAAAPIAPIAQPARPGPRRSRAAIVALLSITVAALGLFAWKAQPEASTRFDDVDLRSLRVSAARRIAADESFELDPAISPDGLNIAYVAGDEGAMRLYLRQRDGSQAVPIAASVAGDQRLPRWSPDGTSIAFQADGGVWVVPALGGTARLVLAPRPNDKWFASSPVWSPDGQELAWVTGDTIFRMPVSGGTRRVIATGATQIHGLAWSPDGRWLAAVSGNAEFTIGNRAYQSTLGVAIGNLGPSAIVLIATANPPSGRDAARPVRVLVPPTTLNASPVWLDQRTLIFVSNRGGTRDLFAAHITDDGTLRGEVERITAGLDVHSVSASRDGRQLAYAVFRQLTNIWSIPIPRDAPATLAAATRVTQGTQVVEGMAVSRDGRWLAYDANVAGQQDIFRLALRDGAPVNREAERIVSSPVDDFHPTWSPDGQWIAYYTFRGNVRRAAYVPAGGGTTRLVHPNDEALEEFSPAWTADGKGLLFFRGSGQYGDLYRTDRLDDTTWGPTRRVTTAGAGAASYIGDGRQIVYFSAPGTIRLADSSFRESTSRVLLSPDTRGPVMTTSGAVTGDGTAIIVKGQDATGIGFWSYPLQNGALGAPRVLLRFDDPRRTSPRPEFTMDARFLYFTLTEREADVWSLQLERR
ncbi:BTAD domain-containing putative transcriptional regulator [Gemmatimonas groenlandica]|uniref:Bacterial transcriptional activator domain-containing protein n=1 Tax=Gemmatimonas groenlandica TaxID=2732249 RepID=A0A6M4IRI7_9BACT|nr:BTAD domain-containing putative transcriptional regulator [Gemmatimonas groenlandica]QJR37534.1 hypothetical protein HKW67_19450 [Gemmatimonas groenlandica]